MHLFPAYSIIDEKAINIGRLIGRLSWSMSNLLEAAWRHFICSSFSPNLNDLALYLWWEQAGVRSEHTKLTMHCLCSKQGMVTKTEKERTLHLWRDLRGLSSPHLALPFAESPSKPCHLLPHPSSLSIEAVCEEVLVKMQIPPFQISEFRFQI